MIGVIVFINCICAGAGLAHLSSYVFKDKRLWYTFIILMIVLWSMTVHVVGYN